MDIEDFDWRWVGFEEFVKHVSLRSFSSRLWTSDLPARVGNCVGAILSDGSVALVLSDIDLKPFSLYNTRDDLGDPLFYIGVPKEGGKRDLWTVLRQSWGNLPIQ